MIFPRKKKKEEELLEEEEQECGLVIQFTPVAIYLYVSEDGFISGDFGGAGLDMEDLEGNYIGIDGTYITLELYGVEAVEQAIKQYSLDSFDLPVIRIPVRPR